MPADVINCPNCRAKVDPTFTTHCAECGTSVVSGVESMAIPGARTATTGQPSGFGRFMRGVAFRVLVAALVLGAGAVFAGATSADRDGAGEITDPGSLDAFDLAVGDCIQWPTEEPTEEFDTVAATTCSEPHDAEVYALVEHPAGPKDEYPGSTVIEEWAIDACYAEFAGYVGRTYEAAEELDFTFFQPTEAGWARNDRIVQCLIFRVDEGLLNASVKTGA
jgi:hypothetical protein